MKTAEPTNLSVSLINVKTAEPTNLSVSLINVKTAEPTNLEYVKWYLTCLQDKVESEKWEQMAILKILKTY